MIFFKYINIILTRNEEINERKNVAIQLEKYTNNMFARFKIPRGVTSDFVEKY